MLKQSLNQKLQQKLSPQQIQLMKLIQLPTLSFEQRIKEELEENPALEDVRLEGKNEEALEGDREADYEADEAQSEAAQDDIDISDYLSDDDIPDYRLRSNNYRSDAEEQRIPLAGGITFTQYLLDQLHTFELENEDLALAEYLVGSIDEDGYLRRDLAALVDDLAFNPGLQTTVEKLESLLKNFIQKLDPVGVGGRDLREVLMVQLRSKKQTSQVELAYQILESQFEAFVKRHYKKLLRHFGSSETELREAIAEIERLSPKPGRAHSGSNRIAEHITPDFTISIHNGELELSLNARNAPELRVSDTYAEMLNAYKDSTRKTAEQRKAVLFVKQKLDAARWFIDAIKQRQNTFYNTMSAIMEIQKAYFSTGDERKIKPMILKNVAEQTSLDISTVSRVANSKYVSTPYGTFLIKNFFSESMTNAKGEEVSTREIKTILAAAVEAEDKTKPLTDDLMAKHLYEKGYPIARRTIAKYREQLNIPVARLRKKL